MVGCVFAMNRKYFFDMGAFDEGMSIWGAENVELPLRVRGRYRSILHFEESFTSMCIFHVSTVE